VNEDQFRWVFIGWGLPTIILVVGGMYLLWRDKRRKLRDKAPRRGSRTKKKSRRR
jgi:cytochrome c-type biogenesis protein CcmH/NrfF